MTGHNPEQAAAEAARAEALAAASREWSAAFDAMDDAVCILARDGTIQRCNRSMQRLLALEPADVVGKKCHELMHGTHTFFKDCPYQEMLNTGRRESFELPLDASWYQVTADPLFGEAEEIVGAVHIIRDVSPRRRADVLRDRPQCSAQWSSSFSF